MLSVLFLLSSWMVPFSHDWAWSFHPECEFKVLVPIQLTHTVTDVPTDTELITYHQYHGGSLADTSLALAFVIDHYLLTDEADPSDSSYLRDFFENTIDQILTSVNGTLIYMDLISQPGQDICVWKAEFQNGNGVIRGNSILAGKKYYGLQVFGFQKNKPDDLMSKFLDSFKIIDVKMP